MYARVFVMMKEVSCKQMQLDLLSTTDLHPSTEAAWETLALLLVTYAPSSRAQQPLVSQEWPLSGLQTT